MCAKVDRHACRFERMPQLHAFLILAFMVHMAAAQGTPPPPSKPSIPTKEARPASPDNLELARQIHALIVKGSTEQEAAQMKAYTGTIPRTGKEYKMAAIPGGEFVMGSPATEKNRRADEGPQVAVKLDPFWMGAYEVTGDQYMPFMAAPQPRYKDGTYKGDKGGTAIVDAISGPTSPYTDMTFGMGEKGYPAICMTEHGALKFCQWLSSQTGHFYRLPTEAEWEYAARAGTTTTWFWGDDGKLLDDYAWHFENSAVDKDPTTHPVGQKKPNPWGLYDIYGNVTEWTLDQYSPDWYAELAAQQDHANPFNKPVRRYPRSVRGGSYDDDPKDCRSASRRESKITWKQQDPQLPKSLWYHTNAYFLGFRIVRPLKVPSAEEMHAIWNLGIVGEDK